MLVFALAPDELLATVRRLKDEFGFDLFLDVTAVDWPGRRRASRSSTTSTRRRTACACA